MDLSHLQRDKKLTLQHLFKALPKNELQTWMEAKTSHVYITHNPSLNTKNVYM